MSKDFLVFLIPIGIFLAYWFFGNRPKKSKQNPSGKISGIDLLFKNATKEFSKYRVVNKNGKVMICETGGVRKEPRELVFISLNPVGKKSITVGSTYIVAVYRSVPTGAEMRRDFAPILNKYR